MSDDDRKRERAYAAAWTEVRIRHCLREAATVAHLRGRNTLRDQFIIVAGQTFDEVADELELLAHARPEWPAESEFAIATPAAPLGPVTPGGR